jgi:3-methyladenine DNA glycosylase AlkC
MSSLLKDIYSPGFYKRFAETLITVLPSFNSRRFIQLVFAAGWEEKELKERMKHTSVVLQQLLPGNYKQQVKSILSVIRQLQQEQFTGSSIEFMFFPDFIETYGIDDFETSVKAIEKVTQFTSCEFAVRPFLIKYRDRMTAQMMNWSLHTNEKVRRLATEGMRPRLPWAMAVPFLKKEPQIVFSLLENLMADPAPWVRRSVANNLNDLSKDHPAAVLLHINKWKGKTRETDDIIKHGSRTLLKQGHPKILEYFGLQQHKEIVLTPLRILQHKVRIGETLAFSFSISNHSSTTRLIRLEYAIYYKRLNGKYSKKVFKISEKHYQPGERNDVVRKQSFRLITTRKFYPGEHSVSLIVNGREYEPAKFSLL